MICQFCRQWYIFSGDLSRKETVCLIELIEFYRTYPTYKNLIHILLLRFRNLRVQISRINTIRIIQIVPCKTIFETAKLTLIDWLIPQFRFTANLENSGSFSNLHHIGTNLYSKWTIKNVLEVSLYLQRSFWQH